MCHLFFLSFESSQRTVCPSPGGEMMIIGCILLLQVQHSWANSVLVLLLLLLISLEEGAAPFWGFMMGRS